MRPDPRNIDFNYLEGMRFRRDSGQMIWRGQYGAGYLLDPLSGSQLYNYTAYAVNDQCGRPSYYVLKKVSNVNYVDNCGKVLAASYSTTQILPQVAESDFDDVYVTLNNLLNHVNWVTPSEIRDLIPGL